MKSYITIVGVIDLRLRGMSYHITQQRYNVGSSTVTHIMKRFDSLGISLDELKHIPPRDVEKLFYPPENMRRSAKEAPDFEAIHRRMTEMKHPNLYYLWLEYRKENPDGYQLSQFYKLYNEYCEEHYKEVRTSMMVERKPGEQMFIDWVGDKPKLVLDTKTGELLEVHFFVTTLGFSSYIYAEAFFNEKLESFIAGVKHALAYYGAVPMFLVPDNLKTAVTKHTKDELVLNPVFSDLESFYDVIVLPPPARKPKGKASVEAGVKLLETHLIEPLKQQTFTSLETLNAEVKKIVVEINDREFQDKKDIRKTRRLAFEAYDKPKMRPLPSGGFEICDYKFFSRVPDYYHLEYKDHYYSVLYTNYGKPAILKATISEIIICDKDNKLIWKHVREYDAKERYVTVGSHMPPKDRISKDLKEHDGNYYRRWASRYGKPMETLIDRVLRSSKYEQQSYKTCQGILHECDNKPIGIATEAAQTCLDTSLCSFTGFKRIYNNLLTNGSNGKPSSGKLPKHKNIRGRDSYK